MKDCIILKNKEHKELLEKANASKPDYLSLDLSYNRNYHGGWVRESTNLNFSHKLSQQISNITRKVLNKLRKEEDNIRKEYLRELKGMSRRKLYKFVQNNGGYN